jgi:acetylornithine deacetylase/succinyl-diaminopimelate desuccinylase-like protein
VSGWDPLLSELAEMPRENGTPELQRSAHFLLDALEGAGLEAELVPFTAAPYSLRLAGVLALAAGLLYFRCLRSGRRGAALAVALALPALLLAQLELQVPVFGWIGAQTQHHVRARIPATDPRQVLVFTAHYDTKTDVLDHVERAPVERLAGPIVALMILGALCAGRSGRAGRALSRLGPAAAWLAAGYGVLAFVALSAGALLPWRSPGALDDGASCAVLVRLAERLAAAGPLAHTEVEVLLLSAEEVGVQGSWVHVRERFTPRPALPTRVVNLEGLGASGRHAVLPSERFPFRTFAPDPGLVGLLDRVHRERLGEPLGRLPVGGATDARSFLAHGIPAATLVSLEPGSPVMRGLHSFRDDRARLDEAALDVSLDYLEAVARAVDEPRR